MSDTANTVLLTIGDITFPALGDFEAQKAFVSTYVEVVRASNRIDDLIKSIYRRIKVTSDADRLIVTMALLLEEDADEIVLLLANGRSTGALKLLRGMFERIVTLHHVSRHLEEADRFTEYRHIRRDKVLRKIVEEFGEDSLAPTESEKTALRKSLTDAADAAARVRSSFLVPYCKKCGTTRVNQTWSRTDVVSMAAEGKHDRANDESPAPKDFSFAVFYCWHTAIEETHATLEACERRMSQRDDGTVDYTYGPFPDIDRLTVLHTHYLLIRLVEILVLHFALSDLQPSLEAEIEEFVRLWGPQQHTPAAPPRGETW